MFLTSLLPKLTANAKRVSLSIPKELYDFILEDAGRNKESIQKIILRSIKSHADSRFFFIPPDPDEDIDCDAFADGDFIN